MGTNQIIFGDPVLADVYGSSPFERDLTAELRQVVMETTVLIVPPIPDWMTLPVEAPDESTDAISIPR